MELFRGSESHGRWRTSGSRSCARHRLG
jgi:hypothetical protein